MTSPGWLIAFGLTAVVTILFVLDPSEVAYFPRCPVLVLTGFRCAGCGSQRALHALSHLHVGEAWGYNPLLVIVLPYLLVGWVAESRARNSQAWARFRKTTYGSRAIWVSLSAIIVFTVGRNL